MVRRRDLLWLLLGMCLTGCAGFSYHYYGLEGVDYAQGKLLGDKPENDIPFTFCAPSEQIKHPCIVMKAADFFKMKLDYEDTKKKLEECQAGK